MAKQENQKSAGASTKKPVAKKTRKKVVRNVPVGVAHVKATFNNTIVVITDLTGNVISWASAGKVGFAGSRKSSAFAATVAAQDAAKTAMGMGMKEVEVNLSGPGAGRDVRGHPQSNHGHLGKCPSRENIHQLEKVLPSPRSSPK